MPKLFLRPMYSDTRPDNGASGGIRRVIEAQVRYLPEYMPGLEFTDSLKEADIVATHAGDFYEASHEQLVVSHCHGLHWDEPDLGYQWSKYQLAQNNDVIRCLKQADLITAPTEWVANVIRRGMWATVHVVPHGVDTDVWKPNSPNYRDDYVLWNKTRIDAVCEIDTLVDLARIVPEQKFVSTIGPRTNMPNNLKVTGIASPEMMLSLVQNAGAYLCTTRETFGIGTLEALACGVPVLGWDWGGQHEIITHKETGWLARPGDIKSLVEGLHWCLDNRARIADSCVDLAKQYTWPKAVQYYAGLYDMGLAGLGHSVKCSIIVRNYNLVKYLEECVLSCLDQKCDGDLEVIILDDCSTDDSMELAEQLVEQYNTTILATKLRIVKTPSNLGLAGALNYGISHARGEYILNIDADNKLSRGTLSILASCLDADRNIDIAYGRIKFINDDPDSTPSLEVSGSPDGISAWPPVVFDYKAQLTHKNQIPNTCLYRRRVFDRIGGYRERCKIAEDADFWCRATSFGFTASKVTNMVTFEYRVRDGSMSSSSKLKDWPWESWYAGMHVIAPSGLNNPSILTYEPVQVSVIIPVGPHHGLLVKDALDSVFSQSFKNWECIVVNDSGYDLEWVPSWVKLLSTGGNKGVSYARNMALRVARGTCFVPLDADDILDAQAIEHLFKAWLKSGGYVYCDFMNAESMRRVNVPKKACDVILDVLPHPITGMYPMQPVLKDQCLFDESLLVGEDWDFVAHMTSLGYCGTYLPEALIHYRVQAGGNRESLLKPENLAKVGGLINAKYGGVDMCGCQKGGGGALLGASSPQQMLGMVAAVSGNSNGSADLVLLEYIGNEINMPYTGRATKTEYVFAATGRRKKRFVHRADAKHFVDNLGNKFKYADDSSINTGAADKELVGVQD